MSSVLRFLAVTAMATVSAVAAAQFLKPSEDVSIFTDLTDKAVPKWQNGRLLVWGYQPPAELLLFDRTGQLRGQTPINIPGAGETHLVNAAVSARGGSAVSGTAMNWEGTTAAFVAWISPSGEVERVVRTTPFAPYRLCYAEDDTLWVLGRLLPHPPGSREELPHDVLRQYGPDARLLRTALSRDSFPRHDWRHPATGGFLAIANDVIGVYSVSAKEWVEVSARTGEVRGRWQGITSPDQTRITGVAMTASGAVYASAEHGSGTKRWPAFYWLDKNQGLWARVDAARVSGADQGRYILGIDGDSLLVRKGTGAKGRLDLLWVALH